jgi:hypothetical protein
MAEFIRPPFVIQVTLEPTKNAPTVSVRASPSQCDRGRLTEDQGLTEEVAGY